MSLLLLLRSGVAVTPPPTTSLTIPTAAIEIDFLSNPTATYSDIQTTQDSGVAFWRMNSATTFLDERLAHPGTIIGSPSTTASPYTFDSDLGLAFDGSADGAYVPSASDLASKGDFTIQGWLRVDSLPGATRDVVAKRGGWMVQVTSAGKLVFTLKDDTSTATVTSNTTLTVGSWYHVAGVYDSTDILLYVNGVLDTSTAYSSGWEARNVPIRFAATPSTASPTWQSSTTNSQDNAIPNCTVPGSIASGDLMLAHIHAGGGGGPYSMPTVPTGWNLEASIQNAGSSKRLLAQVYSRVASASEPASYTWGLNTGTRWQMAISRFTGVNSLTPLTQIYSVATAVGTTHATGSHVPNVNNNMVLGFFSSEQLTGWTESSGTERYEQFSGQNAIAMCSQTQSSAASLTITGTTSGSAIGSAMLAVLAGTGDNFLAASMKDWSFSTVPRTASDIARDYASRDSGLGTWTDVSAFTRNFEVTGSSRQYELDQMEAGTTTVLLKDPDRDFDPANSGSAAVGGGDYGAGDYGTGDYGMGGGGTGTGSPYWPNVVPMRKIRGYTTYQGTLYDLFFTYIERWPPHYLALGYQEINLTSVDGFDGLALADVNGPLAVGYSGAQIDALLDKALWPVDKRDLDSGQYVMAAQTLTNAKALGTIQEIAESERGIFFIDQAGVATFHDSAHRGSFTRSTQPQVIFTDTHTSYGIFYQDLQPSFDKDKIINDWVVNPDSSTFGAAAQEQEDADSAARFFRRSNSRSTRLVSNTDALSQAGNLLNETSQPALRFDSLTVLPTTVEAYQACLGLGISDRVTVIRGLTDEWDGDIIVKDCFVEARRIGVQPSEPWSFTFSLSPVSLGNYRSTIVRDGPVSYWRMDTDA